MPVRAIGRASSFQVTIFLGSFLSFFIQPMIGRTLLPAYGGSAAVWITCLVAFQILLLAGYGYAFLPSRGLRRVHLALLVGAALLTGSVPLWKGALFSSVSGLPPSLGVLSCVLALVGLSSLLLSSNATVVQSWVGKGREVYHLYSLSNAGSFVGLLAYPLLVEPFVPLTGQWVGLGVAIVAYAVLLARVKGADCGAFTGAEEVTRRDAASTGAGVAWLWAVIPAVSCGLMTSATTYLTTDFVPMPLLWAVLLAAFLLSYVIGFSRLGEKSSVAWDWAAVVALLFAGWAMQPKADNALGFGFNFAAVLLLLVVACTALHIRLFKSRPGLGRLPQFYFLIALGGAAGGVLTGLVAPLVFDGVREYPLFLVAAAALFWGAVPRAGRVLLAGAVLMTGFSQVRVERGETLVSRSRGFYGVLSVRRGEAVFTDGRRLEKRLLYHGRTLHGLQVPTEERRGRPTMYYAENGGGIAILNHPAYKAGRPLRVALVGLGAGTMAAYGRAGDVYRFYEISPECIAAATNAAYFTFLADTKARVELVEGDARLRMEEDLAKGVGRFDVIVLDAYSGDSIPTHLITREAFDLYRGLLAEGGILAFHLTNWHIDLWPVVKAAAGHLGLRLLGTYSGAVLNEFAEETGWAFLTDGEFAPRMPDCCHRVLWDRVADRRLMTDDCGSLVFNVKFGCVPPFED